MYLRRVSYLGGFLILFALLSLAPAAAIFFPGSWLAGPLFQELWAAVLAAGAIWALDRFTRASAGRLRTLNALARRGVPPADLQTVLDQGLTRLALLARA